MNKEDKKLVQIDSKKFPKSTQEALKASGHAATDETHQDATAKEQEQPKAINLSDRQAVELYTSDPEHQAAHLKIAQQLQEVFKGQWFSLEMITKQTRIKDIASAAEMMLALQLFKLCTAQEGGMKFKHKTKFKIVISPEERLKVLILEKENLLKQIILVDNEMEKVSLEIKNSEQIDK